MPATEYWRALLSVIVLCTAMGTTANASTNSLPTPVLLFPHDGAVAAGERLCLDWLPVQGATRYEVEVYREADAALLFSTRTPPM